ncbi:MAG: BrnT family toxin, partial [Treponema sp.]|nr:BrnT family toxin [Treponema sp.]
MERLDRSEKNTSGEERWQTLGRVGPVFFVVYTERGENKRIITARAADKAERRS